MTNCLDSIVFSLYIYIYIYIYIYCCFCDPDLILGLCFYMKACSAIFAKKKVEKKIRICYGSRRDGPSLKLRGCRGLPSWYEPLCSGIFVISSYQHIKVYSLLCYTL